MSEPKGGGRLFCALALLLTALAAHAVAQQPAAASQSSTAGDSGVPTASDAYRIGVGDVLEVVVTTGSGRSPQLSADNLQVNEKGEIQVFDGTTSAACLTANELAASLKARYLQYKREPLSVVVNVKDYRSQLVAVIGAVKAPGRFELRRPIRLLELLALYAGGPSESSDGRIEIVHTQNSVCTGPDSRAEVEMASASYRWDDTRLGKGAANPYVRAGDVISLADAPQVFVIGNVREPKNIPLKEKTTLTTAIAMAGGTLDSTKADQIRIERQRPGAASKDLIVVNLEAIRKRQAEDVELMPGDIVEVPSSTGRRILRGLLGAVVPITEQGTVRVIR
ncbi:MAG TPA: polysaccharide biosynthesis/export family protein [Pyrinomonadaceae bacterium]|jgi:polysaccharide export outer membrane protein|nr:polysaccharide biosynthesis/export family protein [Pyrinomonadaceae bacterium]